MSIPELNEGPRIQKDVVVRFGLMVPIAILFLGLTGSVAGVWIGLFGRGDDEAMIVRWTILPMGVGALILGGYFLWLRGKGAILFSKRGIELIQEKQLIVWSDIVQATSVEVPTPNGSAFYLCVRLCDDARSRNLGSNKLIGLIKKIVGLDFDLVFNDQLYSMTAAEMADEINRRIGVEEFANLTSRTSVINDCDTR